MRIAGPGDKAGWSVGVDPRKRAVLEYISEKYVSQVDGPRLLVLGCFRDFDRFAVWSEELVADAMSADNVTLTLVNGQARYSVQGKIEFVGLMQMQGFTAERDDADSKMLRKIRDQLMPVLEGKGPIVVTVGTKSSELPVSGLATPLKRFRSVCFSR